MNKLPFFGALAPALLSLSIAWTPLQAREDFVFDGNRPLLSLHGPAKQNAMGDLDSVLQGLLVADRRGSPAPLVIYVHGRGDEPKKSLADTTFVGGNILADIETDDVRVLGLNWDSTPHPLLCGRPIDKAVASGPILAELIERLAAHRTNHSGLWQGRRVVLLVHSMGSFVLREALQKPGTSDAIRGLFDVRLITESDSPAADHATWLPTGGAGVTVVLSNPTDFTLHRSMKCDSKPAAKTDQPRLGVLSAADSIIPRAADAIYMELPLGKTHRVFVRGGSNANPVVCNAVMTLMRGSIPKFYPSWEVNGRNNVLRLPAGKPDRSDACVAGTAVSEPD